MTLSVCSLIVAAIPDAAQLPDALNSNTQRSLRGILPVGMVVVAVVTAFLIWAVFFRKSPRYRKKGALIEGPAGESGEHRRRRRRRRDHRTRNPTRAQTGGLPPPGAGGTESPPL
jgi:hypothetical protein